MNWDIPESEWPTVGRQVREEWPELTATDVREIAGRREVLVEKIVEHYGWEAEEADRQVEEWTDRVLETEAEL